MQKRIRQVFISLKERTCVSYAKIATIGGFCDIDHIIVKATSPDDLPLHEKYVHELLKIFSISPSSYRAFALSFTRRFGKTRSWRVAVKCLLLLHRLLRSLPYDSPIRAELLWTRTNGMLSLYPCNFYDCSSSASEDYTAFIMSYARLLDETLDCVSIELTEEQLSPCLYTCNSVLDKAEQHQIPHDETLPLLKMKELARMIEILPQLQSLIDRVIDCQPTGAASRNFLVQSAMKHVIRDSFLCYATFRREIVTVLDNLIQLPYRSCVAAFGIYKKAAIQADHLSEFHKWCKNMGYCGSYEYPFIDRIPYIQIRALENFLDGMWQLSVCLLRPTQGVQRAISGGRWRKTSEKRCEFDREVMKDMEIEPLIKWGDENDSVGWEDVLEASINVNSCMDSRTDWVHGKGWQMQVYNPCDLQNSNPFYQQLPHRTNFYYGSCPNTPMQYSWGF
ncbi:hypothetical protein DH2020_020556 [Rehmannia glutinosa]|uniref:ENTH domain-containing protein n=1 Tax=Rehmannia glutinosa TaxID=99300 RepID=A0ABR0WGI5_REHGL